MIFIEHKFNLAQAGHSVIANMYSNKEVNQICTCLANAEQNSSSFLRTKALFAIRQLLKNVPALSGLLFNEKMKALLVSLSDSELFFTKAIYFDKPSESNWFVGYHQDLSVSVDQKADAEGYINWTFKKGQRGVQPPINIFQDTVTIRIHLDDTDKDNGALKVIPRSHLKGIVRSESKDWNIDDEVVCDVKRGGGMLMKPLTLHASSRTTNGERRRVIHLEFNTQELAEPLKWLEYHAVL